MTSPIPRFRLYGEADQSADAEFVHLEDIQSRSSLYEWEITAHAHGGLLQLVIVLSGAVRIRLDDRQEAADGPCCITLPPGVVHAFQFQPGTHGYVLTVAEAMVLGSTDPSRPLIEKLFAAARIVALGDSADRIAGLVSQLAAEFQWPATGQGLMFDWLVRAILLLIHRCATPDPHATDGARTGLLTRFRQLVEAHYRDHWPVPRYADALGVTESRLNRLCRTLADKSAFDVIRDRLLLEAKRRLVYIAAPVTALSYELGFQDPAYFCRFFRKQTGMSPAEYRRHMTEPR